MCFNKKYFASFIWENSAKKYNNQKRKLNGNL